MLNEIFRNLDLEENGKIIPIPDILAAIYKNKQITEVEYNELLEICHFRNTVVHSPSVDAEEQIVLGYINKIKNIIIDLEAELKPATFHKECVDRIEEYLKNRFEKKSNTKYLSMDKEIALSCSVSKKYKKRNNPFYWFAFHPQYKDFLEQAKKGFVSFGCGSEEKIVLIPIELFSNLLSKMNVTDSKTRFYWHVHIYEKNNTLFLSQRKDTDIDIAEYII